MRSVGRLGVLIALGVTAALVISSLLGPSPPFLIPDASKESVPLAGRDNAAARSVPTTDSLGQTPATTTQDESLALATSALAAREPSLAGQEFAIETTAATATSPPGSGGTAQNVLFSNGLSGPWTRFTVVGDVPIDADVIVIGVAVYNHDHAWIDDARLTKVSKSTPLSTFPFGPSLEEFRMPLSQTRPFDAPTNLDFEATHLDVASSSLSPIGC